MPAKPKAKAKAKSKSKSTTAKPKLSAARGSAQRQGRKTTSNSRTASVPRSKRLSGSNRSRSSKSSSRSEAMTTTNLDDIRKWAEARQGQPATVAPKGKGKNQEPGILRIDFPGYSGKDTLKPISWEEWYKKFQEKNLAFLYQEKTKNGKESRFFKLVNKS